MTDTATRNVELARRGYEAAMRGDLEAVIALFAPEVRWHAGDPSAPGACRNRQEAVEFMRRARARRPPGELVDLIGAGDMVVAIMGRPAAGGKLQLSANVTTFRDGKVVEMVHYPDPKDALAAAGLEQSAGF